MKKSIQYLSIIIFATLLVFFGLASPQEAKAAQRALNIVGDKNFSSSNLTPEVKKAHDAFKSYMSAARTGANKPYPNPYASTSLDDLYSVGRTGGSYIANLLFALRVTGDLSYLDEVAYLMGKVEANFDSTSSPGLLWLQDKNSSYYGTKYTHKMDNQLTLAALADGTYAFYANRNNGSNYASLATKWLNYLKKWESKIDIYHGLMHPYTNFAKYNFQMYKMTGESKYLTEFNKRQALIQRGIKTGSTPSGSAIAWDHFVVTDSMYPYGCQLSRYVTYTTQAMMSMYFEGAGIFADKSFMEKLARNIKEDTFRNKTPLISNRMCNNNTSYGLGEMDSSVDEANQMPHRSQLNYAYFDSSGVLSGLINKVSFPNSFYYHGWVMLSAARGASVNPPTTGPTTAPTPTTKPTSTPVSTVKPTSTPTPTVKPTAPPTSEPGDGTVSGTAFTVIADTYGASDIPTENYGSTQEIWVNGTPKRIAYLKFDLTSLAGKEISSATFKIRVVNVSGDNSSGEHHLRYLSSSSWTESQVTWNTRPTTSTTFATFTPSIVGGWIEVNITDFVKQNAGKVTSIGIESFVSDEARFYTRETSSKPFIDVSLEDVPGGVVGDANGDGKVDGIDYVIWLLNYKTDTNNGTSAGDFDSSNRVNMDDFVLWRSLYN